VIRHAGPVPAAPVRGRRVMPCAGPYLAAGPGRAESHPGNRIPTRRVHGHPCTGTRARARECHKGGA
jgi:hypothetical protein